MGDITITSAVRSNLVSLQSTADMMSKVQERLSTGKKVNTALDNPNSFFTAKALENRASDLSTLLDDQSQSVQTLKAADKGISAISDLVDAAKAKANQALQSSSDTDRQKFLKEYNELLGQIESVAKDSSYKGKNLLGGTGNDLKVVFNEDGSSKLDITAVDFTDSSGALGLSSLGSATGGNFTVSLKDNTPKPATAATKLTDIGFTAGDFKVDGDGAGAGTKTEQTLTIDSDTTVAELKTFIEGTDVGGTLTIGGDGALQISATDLDITADAGSIFTESGTAGTWNSSALTAPTNDALTASDTLVSSSQFKDGDTLTFTKTDGTTDTLEITSTTKVSDLQAKLAGDNITQSLGADGTLTVTSSAGSISLASSNSTDFTKKTVVPDHGFSTDKKIEDVLGKLKTAQDTLRAQASTFGTNLSIVENRESFTKALINTLEEGAGKLTLADTNKEGANLLALQTQQQLASTTLSLASQASQNVLRLIG